MLEVFGMKSKFSFHCEMREGREREREREKGHNQQEGLGLRVLRSSDGQLLVYLRP